MTSLASAERAVVERIENHSSRTVEEFALDAQGQARVIKDGDLIRVFPLSPKFQNAVTLRGNVAVPGLYPWKEGMRISDLIPSRSALITRDYWNRQNHLIQPISQRPFAETRMNPLNGRREKSANSRVANSRVANSRIPALTRVSTTLGIHAVGHPVDRGVEIKQTKIWIRSYQNTPGNQQRTDQRNASGQADFQAVTSIGKNSAEINWEYALIERLDERDLSTRLIPFRLASAIDDPSSADNQLLKPGDVITIFSRADLELPMEKHATFVRVGGEVNAPGIYRVNPGETLRDVVKMAGGLTSHSYLYASIFTRVSTRLAQESCAAPVNRTNAAGTRCQLRKCNAAARADS